MNRNDGAARSLAWLVLSSFAACTIAIASGGGSALYYTGFYRRLMDAGVTLQHLRPIHETFGAAWIFLGGATVVYAYLFATFGGSARALVRSVRWTLGLWGIAGAGALVTLLAGCFTGREYLGFHPILSVPVLAGWLVFAWAFFSNTRFRLKDQPVYVYMWSVSLMLFVVTFLEGHLYLIDAVSRRPLRDIAVQWKSYGPLVGSFNLLAYGAILYISERVTGSVEYPKSGTAFSLFYVGLLNSFTNYGHHTFHLPQTPWIHWISFCVSMLEVIILLKVFLDFMKLGRRRAHPVAESARVSILLMACTTCWTFGLLILAIAISIPPVNALIHGTHVVVAHAMGSMLGIDSMIFWACYAAMIHARPGIEHPERLRRGATSAVLVINFSLAAFLAAFFANGFAAGWSRYMGPSAPDCSWVSDAFPSVMAVSGACLACAILWLQFLWSRAIRAAGGRII